MKLIKLLRIYLRLGVANTTSFPAPSIIPAGMVADPSNAANFGLISFMANAPLLSMQKLVAIPISTSTTPVLTTAQFFSSVLDVSGSPGGGWTLTTPTLAAIIAAVPPTMPKSGFNYLQLVMNDACGQTLTYTAGTSVTVSATTATLATNTSGLWLININVNANTVTCLNCGGGWTL